MTRLDRILIAGLTVAVFILAGVILWGLYDLGQPR